MAIKRRDKNRAASGTLCSADYLVVEATTCSGAEAVNTCIQFISFCSWSLLWLLSFDACQGTILVDGSTTQACERRGLVV